MRRIAVFFAIAACGDQAAPPDPYVEVALIPTTASRDLDLLFVIDDSTNLDMVTSLRTAFPVLLSELTAANGQLPNLHIGVVTPDLGTMGYTDATPGPAIGSGPGSCSGVGKAGQLVTNGSMLVHGTFISDVMNSDGSRTVNYDDTLDRALSSIASVGAGGCGFEQPLEAMRIALLDPSGANTGFLRGEVKLAIITLEDEDDCSFSHSTLLGPDVDTLGPLQSFRCTRFGVRCDVGGETPDAMATVGEKAECHANESSDYLAPMSRYRELLESIKSDNRNVLFAMLAGDPTPVTVELRTPPGGGPMVPALAHSCQYEGRNGTIVADPAVRMTDLAHQLRRGMFEGSCHPAFDQQLQAIGRQLRNLLGDTCLPTPLSDDCKVFADTSTRPLRELPSCASASPDCYVLIDDPACGGGVRLHATWSILPGADTMLSVRCRH